jgi:hypothetical protein
MIITQKVCITKDTAISNSDARSVQSNRLRLFGGTQTAVANTPHDFLLFFLSFVFPPSRDERNGCGVFVLGVLRWTPPGTRGCSHRFRSLLRRNIFPAFLACFQMSISRHGLRGLQKRILSNVGTHYPKSCNDASTMFVQYASVESGQ